VLQRTLLMGAATARSACVLGYPVAYRLANTGRAAAHCCSRSSSSLLDESARSRLRVAGPAESEGHPQPLSGRLGVVGEPSEPGSQLDGALIGMVQIMLPYLILPLAATMMRVNPELLRRGTQSRRAPLACSSRCISADVARRHGRLMLVFTLSLGFFVIPAILGGTRDIFLAQLIEFNINQSLNWGFASALSLVLVATTWRCSGTGDRWFGLRAGWGVR
jgi:putative spermidine/putrescine transport system permease protein